MYRAILPNGDIECDEYEKINEGINTYTEDGELFAFIPYQNLVAIVNEDIRQESGPGVM